MILRLFLLIKNATSATTENRFFSPLSSFNDEKLRHKSNDVQIIRKDKKFNTSAYRQSSFSGVYAYFESFLPSTYKFGTV